MVLQSTLAKPKWHMLHSYVCITCTLADTSVSVVLIPSHYTTHAALGWEWNESYVRTLFTNIAHRPHMFALNVRNTPTYTVHIIKERPHTLSPCSPTCTKAWQRYSVHLTHTHWDLHISCCSLTNAVMLQISAESLMCAEEWWWA